MSIGEDSEENYGVIDIQIEAEKAVRRITDHLEIVIPKSGKGLE